MKSLFIFSFLLIYVINSAQTVSISGKVVTKEFGEPVSLATIQEDGTTNYTTTDEDGNFKLPVDASKEKLKLSVNYFCLGLEKPFAANLKKQTTGLLLELIDICPLLPDPDSEIKLKTYTLDKVTVSSSRSNERMVTTHSVIDNEEIKTQNVGPDIPFLLDQQPSVVTTSDAGAGVGYTGIRIRGVDATRINVTVNGITINDAESQGMYWVDLPDLASSVRDIEIQRGVGTSVSGAGSFGGAVNIRTNSFSNSPFGKFASSFGSFNTYKSTIALGTGLLGEKFSFDARLSNIHSDGYIDRASSDLRSAYLSAVYYDGKNLAQLIFMSGKEKTYQAWYGIPQEALDTNRTLNLAGTEKYPDPYDNEIDHYNQDHLQFFFSRQQNENLLLSSAFYFTHGSGYYEQYKADESFSSYALNDLTVIEMINDSTSDTVVISETDLIRRRWLDNNLYGMNLNAQYEIDKFLLNIGGSFSFYDGKHFGEIIWMKYAGDYEKGIRYYDGIGEKTDASAFIKSAYSFSDRFNAFVDLQIRNVTHLISGTDNSLRVLAADKTWMFFNPKAGFNFLISEKQSAYTTFGIANKEPSRDDLVDAPQNSEPKPERLGNFELGYKFSSKKFIASANLYLMNYKDQLVLTGALNDVGNVIRTNVPESYRSGIELSATIKPTAWLHAEANATLSKNKIKNFTEIIYTYDDNYYPIESLTIMNEYDEPDISFSPSVVAGGTISILPVKNLSLNFISKYVSKQFLTNTSDENRKLDAYFLENVRINYSLSTNTVREILFTLTVNNLFNSLYESNGYSFSESYAGDETVYHYNYYYPQAGINWMIGASVEF